MFLLPLFLLWLLHSSFDPYIYDQTISDLTLGLINSFLRYLKQKADISLLWFDIYLLRATDVRKYVPGLSAFCMPSPEQIYITNWISPWQKLFPSHIWGCRWKSLKHIVGYQIFYQLMTLFWLTTWPDKN